MEAIEFEQMKARVGFTSADADRLRKLGAVIGPQIPQIVDLFYERLLTDPQARAIFVGQDQLERQRVVLRSWMEELFAGVYGRQYFEHRSEIGKAHVRAELPQRFMFTGMNIIRNELCRSICFLHLADEEKILGTVNKLLDLELAIMLETYRENYVAKIRAADKRAMQRQLDEVQHMATIGQLAASLAHEIKNPIAGISGAIQIISQTMDKKNPHYEIMREILRQIDRLDSAVKDLLIYARPKAPERRMSDVGETIRSCLALLNEDPAMKSMKIEHQGLNSGIRTMLDKSQFSQVVSNVVLNAAQACDGQGIVRITLSHNGNDVAVTVTDNGPGMSTQVVERAMEPFFTTKARGTGLGLPICKRIIEAHHGKLAIQTAPMQGTTITIQLPGLNNPTYLKGQRP